MALLYIVSGADTPKVREREPFFRDALVRMAHRTPFTNPKDLTVIDVARMKAALLPAAQAIAGGSVTSIELMSQTPKKRISPPSAAAGH